MTAPAIPRRPGPGRGFHTHGARQLAALLRHNKLDLRTRPAKAIRATEDALIDQLGGIERVTAAMRMVIRHVAIKHYRLTLMDQQALCGRATWDARDYTCLSNSLSRDLALIGLRQAAREPERLEDYLRRRTVAAPQAAGDTIDATPAVQAGGDEDDKEGGEE